MSFPSPARDYLESQLDLNKLLIKSPSSTFYARVKSADTKYFGIKTDSILIIDKSIKPSNGKFVVCFIENEFTMMLVSKKGNNVYLVSDKKNMEPILITEENNHIVFGVVTYVINPM